MVNMEWRTLETVESQPSATHRYRLVEVWSAKPNHTYWIAHYGSRGPSGLDATSFEWTWSELGTSEDKRGAEALCEAHFSCFTIVIG